MSSLLSRTMTSFTMVFALSVGVAAVRLVTNTQSTELTIDTTNLKLLKQKPTTTVYEAVEAPEMAFSPINIQAQEDRPIQKIVKSPNLNTSKIHIPAAKLSEVKVSKNELPFQEPVVLSKINFEGSLLLNMVALYQDFSAPVNTLVAEVNVKTDEVKSVQAAAEVPSIDAEPEFFEYESKKEEVKVAEAPVSTQSVEAAPIEEINVSIDELQAAPTQLVEAAKEETVELEDNLIAFDYSALKKDIQEKKVPTVSMVDTTKKKSAGLTTQKNAEKQSEVESFEKKAFVSEDRSFHSQMTIQGVATDLNQSFGIKGFEIKFQDNMSEIYEDHNNSEIHLSLDIANQKMTRSMVMLKQGFVPTNTDLIIEDGARVISIPMITQDKMDKLMESSPARGEVGSLLVELDDETEKATLDVDFTEVVTLDGDMRETQSEDFRYQLFVGVKAGNAVLSYHHSQGVTHKIVHIHNRELTYEANFYEDESLNQVSLYQEDLLSREKSPLVTASQNVRVFAKDVHGEKLSQNSYKIDFGRTLLGSRNYLELTHESESIFVGTKNRSELVIPSESLMRHILNGLPGKRIGQNCVVQVNLNKKVSEVEVFAESSEQTISAGVQYLDYDGKFYDSASSKTRKIVIIGENQSSDASNMNGKINIKIQYLDGSSEYLGSYCSANSYLVEQL